MENDNKTTNDLEEIDLDKITGGMVNFDGSYSFYAGQIIYLNKSRNTYVEVLEASNFVAANYKVPIRYHSPLKAFDGLEKPVDAEALQIALNQGF